MEDMRVKVSCKKTTIEYDADYRKEFAKRIGSPKVLMMKMSYRDGKIHLTQAEDGGKSFSIAARSVGRSVTFYLEKERVYAEIMVVDNRNKSLSFTISPDFTVQELGIDGVRNFYSMLTALADFDAIEMTELIDPNPIDIVPNNVSSMKDLEERYNAEMEQLSGGYEDAEDDSPVVDLVGLIDGADEDYSELDGITVSDATQEMPAIKTEDMSGLFDNALKQLDNVRQGLAEEKARHQQDYDDIKEMGGYELPDLDFVGIDSDLPVLDDSDAPIQEQLQELQTTISMLSEDIDGFESALMNEKTAYPAVSELFGGMSGADGDSAVMSGLINKIAEQNAENEELSQALDKERTLNARYTEQLASAEELSQEQDATIDDLRRQLKLSAENQRKSEKFIQDARDEVRRILTETDAKVEEAVAKVEAMKEEVAKANAEKAAAEKKMRKAVSVCADKERELQEAIELHQNEAAKNAELSERVEQQMEAFMNESIAKINAETSRADNAEKAFAEAVAERDEIIASYEATIAELNKVREMCQSANAALEEAQGAIAKQAEEIEKGEEIQRDLKSRLTAKQSELDAANAEIVERDNDIMKLLEELKSVEGELMEVNSALTEKELSVEAIKNSLGAKIGALANAAEAIAERDKIISEAKEVLDQTASALSDSEAALSGKEAAYAELNEAFESNKAQLSEANEKLREALGQIEEMHIADEEKQDIIFNQSQELEKLDSEIAGLNSAIRGYEDAVRGAMTMVDDEELLKKEIQEQLDEKTLELGKARARIAEVEAELSSAIVEKEKALEAANKALETAEITVNITKEDAENLVNAAKEEAANEIAATIEASEAKFTIDKTNLDEKLAQVESEKADLLSQMEALNVELADAKNSLDEALAEAKSTADELASMKERAEVAETSLDTARKQADEAEKNLARVTAEKDEAVAAATQVVNETKEAIAKAQAEANEIIESINAENEKKLAKVEDDAAETIADINRDADAKVKQVTNYYEDLIEKLKAEHEIEMTEATAKVEHAEEKMSSVAKSAVDARSEALLEAAQVKADSQITIERLQAQLAAVDADEDVMYYVGENVRLENEVKSVTAERDQYRREAKDLKKASQAEQAQAEADNSRLAAELAEAKAALEQSRQETAELTGAISMMKQRVEDANRSLELVDAAEAERDSYKDELEAVKSSNEVLLMNLRTVLVQVPNSVGWRKQKIELIEEVIEKHLHDAASLERGEELQPYDITTDLAEPDESEYE